jgi:hypothetical protein
MAHEVNKNSEIRNKGFDPDDTEALRAHIFSLDARWAVYFFTLLDTNVSPDRTSILTNVLCNRVFMESVGMEKWTLQQPSSDAVSVDVRNQEALDRILLYKRVVATLLDIKSRLAIVSGRYKTPSNDELQACLLDLEKTAKDEDENSLRAFVKPLQTFVDPNERKQYTLNMNIPLMADMFTFATSAFNHRYTLEEVNNTYLVEAIEQLPYNLRLEGLGLVERFLEAWKEQKNTFGNYFRECNVTEAAEGIIPEFGLYDREGVIGMYMLMYKKQMTCILIL